MMSTPEPGVPYTDTEPDDITLEVQGDNAVSTAATNGALAAAVSPRGAPMGRWYRAAADGRAGSARAKVLFAGDSYGTLGNFSPLVGAIQQTVTGALPVIAGLGFTQPADFTGGTMQSNGWNARNKVITPGNPISIASGICTGATLFFGPSPGATIELWVNGSKVGEGSAATGGRLYIAAAVALGTSIQVRATNANVNFYGLYGHQNIAAAAPAAAAGVEIMLSAMAGLGISTVVSSALTESMAFADLYDPDLLIMGHMINSSAETYRDSMNTFIAAFREVCPTTSIVLMAMPQAAGRDDASTTVGHVYEIAARYDCAVCDTFEVLGDLEGSIYSADGTHLNTAGAAVFNDRVIRDIGSPLTPVVGTTAADGIRFAAGNVARQDYVDGATPVTSAAATLSLTVAQTKRHVVTMTSGSANTVNLPLGAAIGAEVEIIQVGAGATTVACPGGTITGPALTATAQHQKFHCRCTASNTWRVGRLT